MSQPTRASQIIDYLPTVYYQDALLRHVVEAIAARMAEAQTDMQRVMNAHYVDTADSPAYGGGPAPDDLLRIGALVPLAPFPDEEQARQTPETVLLGKGALIAGPDGPLAGPELLPSQRLFVAGTRNADGVLVAQVVQVARSRPPVPFEITLSGLLAEITPPSLGGRTTTLRMLLNEAGEQSATVLLDSRTVLAGTNATPLTPDQLTLGQRLFVGGNRRADQSDPVRLIVQATLAKVGAPGPADPFATTLVGQLDSFTPATPVDPQARLVLLTGSSGAELYRQRLKLTIEAFLEGAGTAPAILKMVAATMGWGPLQGTFADWSKNWRPDDPVFEALAEGAPEPIRLRELPLRPAATPTRHAVKAGARWIESNSSAFVVRPAITIRALDRTVIIPTIVNLDAQVSIAAVLALETSILDGEVPLQQEVTLRIGRQDDGTLRGILFERGALGAKQTIVTDRLRVQTSGLRVDKSGATGALRGGTDTAPASLVISDSRRAIRLTARGEGAWGNTIHVARQGDSDPIIVQLTYQPSAEVSFSEAFSLADLVAGKARLVTAEDFTFTITPGESHWLYFDHIGWGPFDSGQWDRIAFDEPIADGEIDPNALFEDYPAKGVYDYAAFNQAVFPQEFLRAFRFDQPGSVYDGAFFNDTPEQVEVLLEWQEGQRATVRIDVPVRSQRDLERLAFLPETVRRVKAAGIKVILASRFGEQQPLGDRLRLLHRAEVTEVQSLGDASRLSLRSSASEAQPVGDLVVSVFDNALWDDASFDTEE